MSKTMQEKEVLLQMCKNSLSLNSWRWRVPILDKLNKNK